MAKRKSYQDLLKELDMSRLPRHIGIIMDGNGRWAKKRFLPRLKGHIEGVKAVRKVMELGVELKLEYMTFYAFSTENWNRPKDEVQGLLRMLKERLIEEIPELNQHNIYVQFVGSRERLDPAYLEELYSIAAETHQNDGMIVNIAFNYGGRQEIVEALRRLASEKSPEEMKNLSAEQISDALWTSGQPDPDLIIRTSGEYRLSNFLLWQSAYAEIYITETLWPDFDKSEFAKALIEYQRRNRRFGGLSK
ncbi:MAG TPA: isoprenyl transferase [Candidatus Cloacimonadota bacterium]|nr:isoprenyl transferase [Candidatus Cloacimonadota bacterium]